MTGFERSEAPVLLLQDRFGVLLGLVHILERVAQAAEEQVAVGVALQLVVVVVDGDVVQEQLEEVEANLSKVLVCEIKSTKKDVAADFRGYFFGLTAAEVLVAQSLKAQFRFIFVNTVTGAFLELQLNEIFAKARGIYPTWSISF